MEPTTEQREAIEEFNRLKNKYNLGWSWNCDYHPLATHILIWKPETPENEEADCAIARLEKYPKQAIKELKEFCATLESK